MRHMVWARGSNVLGVCTVSSEMYDTILDLVKDRRWRARRQRFRRRVAPGDSDACMVGLVLKRCGGAR
jgi:hypothetical protein